MSKKTAELKTKNSGSCHHLSPCGDECIMSNYNKHVYHTCRDENCPHCHGEHRFPRHAKREAKQ